MSSSNRYLFTKLNNYDYSPNNIINIKTFKKTNNLPSELITNHKKELFKKRFNDFDVKDNKLIYKPLNLEVVETDEEKQIKLKELYNDFKIGPGSSTRNFYYKVIQKYLNITRDDIDKFIKDQPAYQITTHQKQKAINKPTLSFFPNQQWSTDLIDMTL